MKSESFENLNAFFDRIKSIGFFERLFNWKGIVSISYDAYEEFKAFDKHMEVLTADLVSARSDIKERNTDLEHQKDSYNKLHNDSISLKKEIERNNQEIKDKASELGSLKEADEKNTKRISELEKDIDILKAKQEDLTRINKDVEKKIAAYEKGEKQKQEDYEKRVTELNALIKQLDDDRLRIQQEREEEIKEHFEVMRETWRHHEDIVEKHIKSVCRHYQIEYLDKEKCPFKGKPDNTIEICEEFVIFDAKSPQSDDLNNFPSYIKNQAEGVKKYVKEKGVKKDVFLVIPSNTVDAIEQFYYNMADYNVYVITPNALEPIILTLRKIEDYEFAEQLSPEDRESICRIIGKFAHASKRRIQIDSYFCNEFISILSSCNNLPADILEKAVDFEKSDKMNPPLEKRAKTIPNQELKKEIKKIKQEADAKEINTKYGLEVIKEIPLYKE